VSTREFWLGRTDPVPLALYRAGFGALVAFECLTRLPHATELYSDEGFHLGTLAHTAPSPVVATAAVALCALASIALALGYRTRLAAVTALALWSWLYGIDQLNERALHSLILVVLALLALSGAGDDLSLDARRRGAPAETVSVTPLRVLQLHFAQMYFFAGVVKILSPGWATGDVLAASLSSRWATDTGLWVAGHMPAVGWRALALATIVYELVGPWLLFVRWARPWVIAVGLTFHLGVQLTLGVGWLGPHFMLALVALYPEPETWRAVVNRAAGLRSRRSGGSGSA
jgi:hypothetical protein